MTTPEQNLIADFEAALLALDPGSCGPSVLLDGDCEKAGVADWSVVGATATLTKQTTTPFEGGKCLRIAAKANAGAQYPTAAQAVIAAGTKYLVEGRARSDGAALRTPKVFNWIGGDPAPTVLWTGAASTAWQKFSFTYAPASGSDDIEFGFSVSGPSGGEYVEFDIMSVRPLLTDAAGALLKCATHDIPEDYFV